MTFTTMNTRYTLIDTGDGGVLLQGNPEYTPEPTPMRLVEPITVGKSGWFQYTDGPKQGTYNCTSVVQTIEEE